MRRIVLGERVYFSEKKKLVEPENDETNGPMLRVNKNLGYRPIGSMLTWSRP